MKAIMELGPKKIRLQEQPQPSIQADEILMKVKINGLCQNDVRDYTGRYTVDLSAHWWA